MAVEIILDAGHGGFDNGAVYRGRAEKDDVLRLTMDVGSLLKEDGYTVRYIRTEDVYESPYQKAEKANQMKGDIFISFHRNSGVEENLYNGVQALVYSTEGKEAVVLGEAINKNLEDMGFRNLGVEAIPDLIVLHRTQMPAVLMEVGFINSDTDNQIWEDQYPEIVKAIVSGIEETFPLRSPDVHDVGREGGIMETGYPNRKFYVQTGLFKYDVNAAYQLERLQMLGFDGIIHYEKPYYGVWIGGKEDLDEVVQTQKQLQEHGYQTLIVSE